MATAHPTAEILTKFDNFVRIVPDGNATGAAKQLIVHTRVEGDGALVVCVTDGRDVWKTSGLAKTEQFADLCTTIVGGSLKLHKPADDGVMTVSHGKHETELNKLTDGTTELQQILFSIAERSANLETKLKIANDRIEHPENTKGMKSQGPSVFEMGYDSKRKKAQAKTSTATKQPGMSVVNPGSKKRQAPKGVEFGV